MVFWGQADALGLMEARDRKAWKVRELRTAAGITQELLSSESGVAVPYLSGIERGVVNPTLDVLDRLAKALNVDVGELLLKPDGTGERPKSLPRGRKPNG
jgi:transcriptional regulator with XRE-family HTH domain